MRKVVLFIKAMRRIGNPGYVPTTTVDKNGKRVTVYKLAGDRESSRKVERFDIERLYEYAKKTPLSPPDSMRLVLGDQLRIIFDKGPASIAKDGEIVVRGRAVSREHGTSAGFGMVKIIWRHGEMSPKAGTPRQVTKADILRLPHLLRDIPPNTTTTTGGVHMEWRVIRHDGAEVVYGVQEFTHTDGLNHVITIHVVDKSVP